MRVRTWRPWLAAWCAVVSFWLLCCGSALATPLGSITQYPIAHVYNNFPLPVAIAAGPDGNLWFTDQSQSYYDGFGGLIGEINPSSHKITEYPIPDQAKEVPTDPFGIIAGPGGLMWFGGEGVGEGAVDSIGAINPTTHQFSEYPIPITGGNLRPNPQALAVGPDRNIWFTEIGTIASIGELDLSTHAISQYPVPGGDPEGIAAGPDGNVWFANGTSIGEINPATHQITEFPIPPTTTDTHPGANDIAAGPNGDMWFTNSAGGIGN